MPVLYKAGILAKTEICDAQIPKAVFLVDVHKFECVYEREREC